MFLEIAGKINHLTLRRRILVWLFFGLLWILGYVVEQLLVGLVKGMGSAIHDSSSVAGKWIVKIVGTLIAVAIGLYVLSWVTATGLDKLLAPLLGIALLIWWATWKKGPPRPSAPRPSGGGGGGGGGHH